MAKQMTQEEINQLSQPVEVQVTRQVDPMVAFQKQVLNAEVRKKELHKLYKEEEKIPMYLSPMYRPYFGNVMRVMINGISIFFKVDGSSQVIPKTFADEVVRRRKAVDSILTKQNRMARIPENNESNPGELNLF